MVVPNEQGSSPLQFICSDIKLVPCKHNIQLATPLSNIKYFKKDWIECLMEWVFMNFPIILHFIDVISQAQSQTLSFTR